MRVSLLLALGLAGCGVAQSSVVPPPPSLPAPAPTAPAPAPVPAPTAPAPAPTTRPAPSKEIPAGPAPPAVLSPGATPEDERRLSTTAQSRIDGAEQLVREIDAKRMAMEQQESFSTIQSFLAKAREAMSAKDYQRAFTLADKAHQLAEDLARRVR